MSKSFVENMNSNNCCQNVTNCQRVCKYDADGNCKCECNNCDSNQCNCRNNSPKCC